MSETKSSDARSVVAVRFNDKAIAELDRMAAAQNRNRSNMIETIILDGLAGRLGALDEVANVLGEDSDPETLVSRVSPTLYDELREMAKRRNRSAGNLVRMMILVSLDRFNADKAA